MISPRHLSYTLMALLLLCIFFEKSWPHTAYAQGSVTVDLSKRDIPIEWNFTGASILLFGAIEKQSVDPAELDVIIIVKGPDQAISARRKQRVAGIWINTRSKNYREVPAFYSIVSTRPITEIAAENDLELMGIGLKSLSLRLAQSNGEIKEGQPDEYSQAIVRLMQRDGLYNEVPNGVKLVGGKLFRADIKLPSNVPVGNFHTDVYLFHKGQLSSLSSLPLSIQKEGVERLVYWLAYDFPYIYGIAAVLIAISAGLLATAVFRDD